MAKGKKKHKASFFKILFLLGLAILVALVLKYYNYNNIDKILEQIEISKGNISDYYIYGIHFNISGSIELNDVTIDDVSLVLKSANKEIDIEAMFDQDGDKLSFKLSDEINGGYNLNELETGKYYLLLKLESGEKIQYYSFENNSAVGDLEYYTVTQNNKNYKININYDDNDGIFMFNVEDVKQGDFYDITIDAGHGKIDTGSSYTLNGITYYEADLTLKVALSLKEKLEDLGYKVLLTRSNDVDLDYYGEEGRAVIPNKYKTKLTISIHLNSEESVMNYGGVEVYTSNDIDYTFAQTLADEIKNTAATTYSLKQSDKVSDGVYYSYFDTLDIKEAELEALSENKLPYDIEVGACDMYMIREVGGKMTKAYVDGRNEEIGKNIYYDSSMASEAYLIELGYISYPDDLQNVINNYDKYALGIANAIKSYLK